MLAKLPKQGRIKAKYNATPTAREKEFHQWLMASYRCACGCGGRSTVVHHPLTRHPDQRWRRDHEFVVPMVGSCHMELHARGHEREAPFKGLVDLAWWYRREGIQAGQL